MGGTEPPAGRSWKGDRGGLIGDFKNAGAIWCWQAEEVNCHDFVTDAVCRAVPYGVYDVLANSGFVRVGLSANTPAFAVAAVRLVAGRPGPPASWVRCLLAPPGATSRRPAFSAGGGCLQADSSEGSASRPPAHQEPPSP